MHFIKRISILSTALLVSRTVWSQEGLYVSNGSTVSVTATAQLTVAGNVSSANGSLWVNNGTVRIAGNWADETLPTGSYAYGTGSFGFTGSGIHQLKSPNVFYRIDADGGDIDMLSDIRAIKWYLRTGVINTNAFTAVVEAGAGTAGIEAHPSNQQFTASWFNGLLRRYVFPAMDNEYVFPVGNAVQSNRAVLGNLVANPLTGISFIDASFGPKPGDDAGLLVSERGAYVAVHADGVWYITSNTAPVSGRYDLSLYTNGFTGLSDNRFGILLRPLISSSAADWVVPAGSHLPPVNSPGRLAASGFALRNSISTFGQFGIGISTTVLPVTLTSFNVMRMNRTTVALDWETATELYNKGFDVERRYENENVFRALAFVPSAAPNGMSSSPLSYRYTDVNSFAGVSYYRLKQTDIDGYSVYTMIKAVDGVGDRAVTILIWPNPASGQFSIRAGSNDQPLQAFITDMHGRLVQRVTVRQNEDVVVRGLSAGMYVVRIPDAFGEGKGFCEKVMVVK